MTKDLLNQLILMAEKCHAKVRVMVCDMGNTKLLKELNVYRTKYYYFPNPINQSRKVYIVTCIPHCFKNLRNNTLDYKLIYNAPDGKEVRLGKELFEQLIQDDSELGDLKFCPKLSDQHVQVQGHDRQRVKLATQLFSDTVSKALIIISTFDQFFDVMDSRTKHHWKKEKCALGNTNKRPQVHRFSLFCIDQFEQSYIVRK